MVVTGSVSSDTIYSRVLLKISGESLQGAGPGAIDANAVAYIADQIIEIQSRQVEIGVVIGGGNIWRGVTAERQGMTAPPRTTRDAGYHHQCPGSAGCY